MTLSAEPGSTEPKIEVSDTRRLSVTFLKASTTHRGIFKAGQEKCIIEVSKATLAHLIETGVISKDGIKAA